MRNHSLTKGDETGRQVGVGGGGPATFPTDAAVPAADGSGNRLRDRVSGSGS